MARNKSFKRLSTVHGHLKAEVEWTCPACQLIHFIQVEAADLDRGPCYCGEYCYCAGWRPTSSRWNMSQEETCTCGLTVHVLAGID